AIGGSGGRNDNVLVVLVVRSLKNQTLRRNIFGQLFHLFAGLAVFVVVVLHQAAIPLRPDQLVLVGLCVVGKLFHFLGRVVGLGGVLLSLFLEGVENGFKSRFCLLVIGVGDQLSRLGENRRIVDGSGIPAVLYDSICKGYGFWEGGVLP